MSFAIFLVLYSELLYSKLSVGLFEGKGKGIGSIQLLMELHLTATECHLPYGITQCYLPPDTSEHTPP